jgi:hypothetical protein
VCIDLNVRVRGNQTFTAVADADGPLVEGQGVEVYESESEIYGPATVTEIDRTKGLVYLAVEWAKLREAVITLDEMRNFVAGVAAAAHPVALVTPANVHQITSATAPLLELDQGETYGSEASVYRPPGSVLSRT